MKIKLSLTAPEYAPLIIHYDEFFHENHAYEFDWKYDVLPCVGDYISFGIIKDLVKEHVDEIKLPEHWSIVDIKWNESGDSVIPTLFIVGK